jgi:hypothetical protein
MERIILTRKMIKYLEKTANCKNIIEFVNKHILKETSNTIDKWNMYKNKLIIKGIPVSYYVIRYNDDDSYRMKDNADLKDITWKNEMYESFDFITESNYTGFEYFPYLYGVLDCHSGPDSRIYVFHEFFDKNLVETINTLEHPSEWYDIVFQLIIICYYMQIMNSYTYNGNLNNYFCRKLEKSHYKKYKMGEYILNINHNFLIVLLDFKLTKKSTKETRLMDTIDLFLIYTKENKHKLKVPPSGRVVKLLYDIKNDPYRTVEILYQYFGLTINK